MIVSGGRAFCIAEAETAATLHYGYSWVQVRSERPVLGWLNLTHTHTHTRNNSYTYITTPPQKCQIPLTGQKHGPTVNASHENEHTSITGGGDRWRSTHTVAVWVALLGELLTHWVMIITW